MKIKLIRDWFTPEGILIDKGEREVSSDLFAVLPKSAQVWDGNGWKAKADLKEAPADEAPKVSVKSEISKGKV